MDEQEREAGTKALDDIVWVSKLTGGGVIARMFTKVCLCDCFQGQHVCGDAQPATRNSQLTAVLPTRVLAQKDNSLMDTHYVVGSRAPFIFRAGTQKIKGSSHVRAVWAIYAGKYAANASNMVQGGAVASSECRCPSLSVSHRRAVHTPSLVALTPLFYFVCLSVCLFACISVSLHCNTAKR